MAIAAAVKTCGGEDGVKVEACTANIGGALATLAGSASFMAEAFQE